MQNEFDELIQSEWNSIVDDASQVAGKLEVPRQVIVLGLAFVMGTWRLDLSKAEARAVIAELFRVWEQSV